eukprot:scaffold246413_cov36-Tisochrysis_lutea.AAC.2
MPRHQDEAILGRLRPVFTEEFKRVVHGVSLCDRPALCVQTHDPRAEDAVESVHEFAPLGPTALSGEEVNHAPASLEGLNHHREE